MHILEPPNDRAKRGHDDQYASANIRLDKAFKYRMGRRAAWRKAYVTLADGQSIDVMKA